MRDVYIHEHSKLNNLLENIHIFQAMITYDPYIICSTETSDLIKRIIINGTNLYQTDNITQTSTFYGCKVLIDPTLPFGLIKLR